jgi:hypothetical protein
LDDNALRAWIDGAQPLLEEADRLEIGLVHIGKVLGYCPADPDGSRPGEVVRDLLEDLQSEQIEEGLYVELLNQRGVTSRFPGEGGVQERRLSEGYAQQAARVADRWPRSAAVLRDLAKSYENEARRHEAEAERYRSGF